MKQMMIATSAVLFSAGIAVSQDMDGQVLAEQLLAEYRAEGFSYIEIERGPSQIKVEAIRDGEETEVVYDISSGAVLQTETESADAEDMEATGYEISTQSTDFLNADGTEIDDDDDDEDDADEDEDEDEDDEDDGDDDEDDTDGDDE